PFCRKRCKFCYFRVYTDKNARDVETYCDALVKEVSLCAKQGIVGDRPLHYAYFGGGTPSYLSADQLRGLMTRLKAVMPWDGAKEVTFECEPGTLQKHKLETLKEMGVTRLSLGIENFDPKILEYNGRAHLEDEIHRAYGWAIEVGFTQINIDLIAGMVGESWENWRECVRKTLLLKPESVTIYQMELPFNTVFSKELKMADDMAVADWPTKRAWVEYAYDTMMAAGYSISSGYTLKRDPSVSFVYRDALWHGADMFGTGVASFGHLGGFHVQNLDRWEEWLAALDRDEMPLGRALPVTPRQRLIREMILQMKTGKLDAGYFRAKFGADVERGFREQWQALRASGDVKEDGLELTKQGLLHVDTLLPAFFEPEHRGARYT
ncbi:MAG: coproporphyrinogen III oxidase family protein, partial [Gemmataceae bacterium]|nr:coproporphyrinogen III oxidase family protein [Gemmataceae bacterium]